MQCSRVTGGLLRRIGACLCLAFVKKYSSIGAVVRESGGPFEEAVFVTEGTGTEESELHWKTGRFI